MRNTLLLLIVVASTLLSAAAKDRKAKNEGPVEVAVQATVERTKSALVNRLQGFNIDSDTQFQLVFSKEITGGRGMLTQILTGNSYSDPPRVVAYFTFVENRGIVTLTGRQETATRMALGQVNRVSLDGGKARTSMVNLLMAVKYDAEATLRGSIMNEQETAERRDRVERDQREQLLKYCSGFEPSELPSNCPAN
jgi:hypothetical protein